MQISKYLNGLCLALTLSNADYILMRGIIVLILCDTETEAGRWQVAQGHTASKGKAQVPAGLLISELFQFNGLDLTEMKCKSTFASWVGSIFFLSIYFRCQSLF